MRWTVIKMKYCIIYLAFYNGRSMIAVLSVTPNFFHRSRLWANPLYLAIFGLGGRMEERRHSPKVVEDYAQRHKIITSDQPCWDENPEMKSWVLETDKIVLMASVKLVLGLLSPMPKLANIWSMQVHSFSDQSAS